MQQATSRPATRKRLHDDRVAELLDVAARVFIEDGFAAASTNKIARLANASKTTFYSRFPTKKDLFLGVIERRMEDMFSQIAKFPSGSDELMSTLRDFSTNLLKIVTSPAQITLVRMISMESERYPELATRFYENGPKRGESALADYLALCAERGALRKGDPALMSQHLMSLLTGGPVRWHVLGFDRERLTPRSLAKHIEDALTAFFAAYAPAEKLRSTSNNRGATEGNTTGVAQSRLRRSRTA